MKRNVMFKILLMIVVGLFLSLDAFAQQMTVKGIVKDTTGEPIIGANVVVKGSSNGTITDFEGNFQFNANKGDIIVISFIGYQAQEVPAAANLNIILKDDTQLLQDVVVIGYGTVKKNDATGSVTAIKPDQLSKGITTNAQDMLSGKVAGVSVISNDGAPGSGAQSISTRTFSSTRTAAARITTRMAFAIRPCLPMTRPISPSATLRW